jgi:hypothetical protein
VMCAMNTMRHWCAMVGVARCSMMKPSRDEFAGVPLELGMGFG